MFKIDPLSKKMYVNLKVNEIENYERERDVAGNARGTKMAIYRDFQVYTSVERMLYHMSCLHVGMLTGLETLD